MFISVHYQLSMMKNKVQVLPYNEHHPPNGLIDNKIIKSSFNENNKANIKNK